MLFKDLFLQDVQVLILQKAIQFYKKYFFPLKVW